MKSDSKFLSAPYTVWMTIFIVLPMLLVGYFAFTDKSGSFTLENILSVGQYSNVFLRSIWLGAVATVIGAGLSFGLCNCKNERQATECYGHAGNAAYVDEFLTSYLCVDDAFGR